MDWPGQFLRNAFNDYVRRERRLVRTLSQDPLSEGMLAASIPIEGADFLLEKVIEDVTEHMPFS